MKYRITEGVNSYDGSTMFYVYQHGATDWFFVFGDKEESKCRQFVERKMNTTERVVAEFGE